ncbi:MAG: sigma 54-interacting transcriptional regulator, partial [Gammaproteobacteria bacterium]|nr:sigma 54-interacting transcriptional regulator [Gammaproteobacteria bacterium]
LPAKGSSLQLHGEAVRDSCQLTPQQLESGQVLVLARRLVLMLHYYQPQRHQPAPGYDLIGESWRLQELRSSIAACAASESPTLLLGESGTGKELVARAIHQHSQRSAGPWVAVNMAAIPAELASAELFGVRKGAFTGAERDKPGYFQQAHGGTLFLDEIGACAERIQPLLLRALQSGEVQVPGGPVEQVDVRVISATDAAIDGERGESFSTALRHRLGALELNLPPLRERREDIGRLMVHFFQDVGDATGQPLPGSGLEALVAGQWAVLVANLAEYRWPGNVRELRNFCRQIASSSSANASFCVPDNILRALQRDSLVAHSRLEADYRAATRLPEDEVVAAMESAEFEPARAARLLNVSRTSLYRRFESIQAIRLAGDIASSEITSVYQQSDGCSQRAAQVHRVSRTSLLRRWRALELTPGGN